MSAAAERLQDVRARIAAAAQGVGRSPGDVRLVAVSKTFGADAIEPVIAAAQKDFGENRVQEALGKWPELRAKHPGLTLHLIGPLQSNKAKDAVGLFDVIQSVDREKIAKVIAEEMAKQKRQLDLFVQVNTGEEPQKAGVLPKEVKDFLAFCRGDLGLSISGLMCIPPVDEHAAVHFAFLRKLAEENNVERLSMGMSDDFEMAVELGATDVRVGSAIFGQRPGQV